MPHLYLLIHTNLVVTILGRVVRSKVSPITIPSMVLSGSKGIGGIICSRTNTIDIFDLEEDEEEEEEEDDDDDDDASNMDSTSD